MTEVLIIEENLSEAELLKQMIEQTATGFKVCGIFSSIMNARVWLLKNKMPQLIFCDIQLADGPGFDIFEDFPIAAPVIFCTSYHEYALEAFENNGIDYLIKPIDNVRLNKSLRKFTQLKELFAEVNSSYSKRISYTGGYTSNYKSSLLVYYQDKIIPINLDQVDFIYYNNYQVTVHTQNGQYETRDTLNNIFSTLNPKDFFRANRQFIVHRKAVSNIQQYFGRKLLIGVNSPTPEPVIISKANASDFLKWVEGLSTEDVILPLMMDNVRFTG
ncbi:LytTR family DNA-binding domain-containing protein [Dyadobacter sp. NIV53]|uniref:LytR/AlgR family response regulator transcription factor n=1 Tax=Dyadobacter sp. NIV53 TaxID=2861765 RepID=UPI001C86EE94|nr:LytTR family DNA-binding domain-containing protein [Dyadobacter sp. NIV53]